MEKLQACVSRLLTWLRRLPGWFQVHLSHLTRVRGIRQRWLHEQRKLVLSWSWRWSSSSLASSSKTITTAASSPTWRARPAPPSTISAAPAATTTAPTESYLSAAQDYVSSFQDGTRLELQYLDRGGDRHLFLQRPDHFRLRARHRGHQPAPAHPDHLRLDGASPPRPGSASPPSPRPCCITASWWASCATSRPCAWSIARSSS